MAARGRQASEADLVHLRRALELGRRGWGRVHPNPMVGCVVVRDGEVVGEGWHEVFGGPHAEIRALEQAGTAALGATAYVSLEPCRHQGKTPACTGALVHSGIQRVVFGASDPSSEAGGGGAELEQQGLVVVGPVLSATEAWRENPAFHHAHRHSTPFVAVKLAMSLDGCIAEAPGRRTALTGPEALLEVQRLRAGFDALLIGGETARIDDPLLTVRADVPCRKAPVRVVLDTRARLRTGAALFLDVDTAPVWVFVNEHAPEADVARLEAAGAVLHPVPAGPGGRGLSLGATLTVLWDAGLRAILCEGGGRLASALLGAGFVRRIYLFVAPRVMGPDGVPAFPDPAAAGARSGWGLAGEPVRRGDDTLLVLDRPEI